jgi:cell division protein FtsQ
VAIPALEQVIAIHEARDLLERNITHVDMRKPSRPTLRLAAPAVDELHRIRAIEFGE